MTEPTTKLTDNFGLPTTDAGQRHHSLLHRQRGNAHPLVGHCPEAQEVKRIEAEARADAAKRVEREIEAIKVCPHCGGESEYDRGRITALRWAAAALRENPDAE
jgi:hypothetical protein